MSLVNAHPQATTVAVTKRPNYKPHERSTSVNTGLFHSHLILLWCKSRVKVMHLISVGFKQGNKRAKRGERWECGQIRSSTACASSSHSEPATSEANRCHTSTNRHTSQDTHRLHTNLPYSYQFSIWQARLTLVLWALEILAPFVKIDRNK